MRIYKISHGLDHFSKEELDKLYSQNLVCVHPDTAALGQSYESQGEKFLEARRGDLFYVCHSNQSVKLIGMFTDDRARWWDWPKKDDWAVKEYKLLYTAGNPQGYDKELQKWWSPKHRSTMSAVPKSEYNLFEKGILLPAFGATMNELIEKRNMEMDMVKKSIADYKELQSYFSRLMKDEAFLFSSINSLENEELKKLKFEFDQRGDVSHQPVVSLRHMLLQKLLAGETVDSAIIEHCKAEISSRHSKNVFKSWKDPFRVLYPFLYSRHRSELTAFFRRFSKDIQTQLGLVDETDVTQIFHFDGAQNQGDNKIWFAIYNKTYKSHKTAKQLLFVVGDTFEFGFRDTHNSKNNELYYENEFDLNRVMAVFVKHKSDIVNDNSKERAEIAERIELLESKGQIILQGPPGTGKTYTAKDLAEIIINDEINQDKKAQAEFLKESERFQLIQFHPVYSYEDFVRGITAKANGTMVEYKTENKVLAKFAAEASKSDKPYVLIIDEINRANLPSVLGELIYALEYRGESVESMYALKDRDASIESADASIVIPENLYIIGTMNTADRSVAHIDYAIRRRFAFVDVLPSVDPIKHPKAIELFKKVEKLFTEIEGGRFKYLAPDFEPKDVQLGHSYFILDMSQAEEKQKAQLGMKLKYEILPILNEYVKDGLLLDTAKEYIQKEIADFEKALNGN